MNRQACLSLLKCAPLLALAIFIGCATPPDYPIEPQIEFVNRTKDTLQQSFVQDFDSTLVTLSFTDGDGDIGSQSNSDSVEMIVEETLTGTVRGKYRIPFVPKLGASNGIKGELSFPILTSCCRFPPELGLIPCVDETPLFRYDKVELNVTITDRAGHKSNVLQLTPVYIRCFD